MRLTRIAIALTLAWGLFAFGATYLWASNALIVACVLSGALAWLAARGVPAPVPLLPIALVLVAVGLQLVPLPATVVSVVSPATPGVVSQLDLLYATRGGSHPLSILPSATWHALWLFVSFAVLLVGLTRLLSATGARWLLWTLTGMGVVLALVGIGQKALGDGIRIYGFWTPQMPGTPFGPFVNRNHFAGWMVMALPVTMALACAGLARGLRQVRPTVRDRLLWLASAHGTRVLLSAAAVVVMSLALTMTMSRSGMASLAIALMIAAVVVLRGVPVRGRRSLPWIMLIGVVALVVVGVGLDAIVTRFGETSWTELNMRRGAWADARDIASRFVVTGTGLNTYGTATLFFQQHDLAQHYAQAHNDYLQLWAEGGLLLAIPAAVFAGAMMLGIWRRFRADERYSRIWWARTGAATGLLAIALQETFEFSLQMPGNAALFVVLCAIALHGPSRPAARSAA